jgi:hypothetical protein
MDGPGPLIPNVPTARYRDYHGASMWYAENRLDLDVDSSYLEFWIGPRLTTEVAEQLTAFVTAKVGPALINVDAERTERFTITSADGSVSEAGRWQDDACEGEWKFAAGLRAGIQWEFAETWYAGASVGYDWVDEVEVNVGPNRVIIDPSGLVVGINIGKQF